MDIKTIIDCFRKDLDYNLSNSHIGEALSNKDYLVAIYINGEGRHFFVNVEKIQQPVSASTIHLKAFLKDSGLILNLSGILSRVSAYAA